MKSLYLRNGMGDWYWFRLMPVTGKRTETHSKTWLNRNSYKLFKKFQTTVIPLFSIPWIGILDNKQIISDYYGNPEDILIV